MRTQTKFKTQEEIEEFMYNRFFAKTKIDERYITTDLLYSSFQNSYIVHDDHYELMNNDYLRCHLA